MAQQQTRTGYLLIAPAVCIIGGFFLLPSCASFALSLTDFDIYGLSDLGNARLVGIDNFRRLFESELFRKALWNTLLFVIIAVPASLTISLIAAVALTSRWTRGVPFFQTVFFLPVVTTLVPVAIVWRYMCDFDAGYFNRGLAAIGVSPVDWLGTAGGAMSAIILLAIWKNFGFNMVIFVAGLTNIPKALYEAADLDGANTWQSFRFVTLPMLVPTTLFIGVTTMAGYLQLFAEPYVMTQGGPLHGTYSMVMMMHEEGFRWWNIGFASAVAVVLFLFVLLLTTLHFRLYRSLEQ